MGQHDAAKELGKEALDIEENELGARPDRMGDLYSMMAAILAEVTQPASFLCSTINEPDNVPKFWRTLVFFVGLLFHCFLPSAHAGR